MTGAKRANRAAILLFAAVLAAPPALLLLSPAPAAAQQQQQQTERRSILNLFFGSREPAVRQQVQPQQQQQVRPRRQQQRAGTQRPARPAEPPQPAEVEKREDASVVLVVGDFVGGGLAQGLVPAFAEADDVRIVNRTSGSSGLVRDDYYDWPGAIDAIIEESEPAVVVVMLGSNDRQQLRVDGRSERPLSEPWRKEYEARASALAASVSEKGLPLVWVGMPSFRPSTMSADMLALNDIYRRVAERAGGEFVDIWDGFVDENGGFVTTGPDINGQPARLRADDGINITAAGRRKIAFYTERPLKRILDQGSAGTAGGFIGPQYMPEFLPDAAVAPMIERTVPISLNDPELDGGLELLGARTETPEEARTPGEKLILEGIAPDPRPGRADDFNGSGNPPGQPATAAGDTTTAIAR